MEIEKVVHERRIAAVKDDINELMKQIHTFNISYHLVTRLLGGRPPTSDKARAKWAGGAWGSCVAPAFRTDVPAAMAALGFIIKRTWGIVLEEEDDDDIDMGWAVLAREVVGNLTAENTEIFFNEFFFLWSMAAERMRTRRTDGGRLLLPDSKLITKQARESHLLPIIDKQDAQETAREEAETTARAVAERILGAGSKRTMAQVVASSPVSQSTPSPATAPQRQPGTPGPPGAPGTGKLKRAERNAQFIANKQAAASTITGLTPAPASTPATAPSPAASVAFAPVPSPAAAPRSPPRADWTPGAGEIKVFATTKPREGAVEYFQHLCKQHGLGSKMPCAFAAMATGGCHGPPQCRTCASQLERVQRGEAATAVPQSVVEQVRAACNADTARRIK